MSSIVFDDFVRVSRNLLSEELMREIVHNWQRGTSSIVLLQCEGALIIRDGDFI